MYAVLGKRGLRIFSFALLLCVAFVIEGFLTLKVQKNDLRAPKQRIEFLDEMGIKVIEDTLTETEVTIPREFSDVYERYNVIQKKAGFNLEDYKGMTVTRYTYGLLDDENVYVNMLCYKGQIIGGDISSTELDGFMLPLAERE